MSPSLDMYFPKDKSIITHSNGGLRKLETWKRAGELLQGSDNWFMWFSIDGLSDTNHLYRRNVKWDILMRNVKAFLSAKGNAYWDMLVFKHNQHQVENVKLLAKQLGFIGTRIKNPDGLVWDNMIQKRGVYDANGKLEYYIEASTDNQYLNAPIGTIRNPLSPRQDIGKPRTDPFDSYVRESYDGYENHSIACKSLQDSGSEIMIQCDGLVLPCCFIGEIWSSGRTDDAKNQLKKIWNTNNLYLTNNKFHDIMNYLDSTIMSTWNLFDYKQGKCMYCAKICGQDSQIDRLIHTKAGP